MQVDGGLISSHHEGKEEVKIISTYQKHQNFQCVI